MLDQQEKLTDLEEDIDEHHDGLKDAGTSNATAVDNPTVAPCQHSRDHNHDNDTTSGMDATHHASASTTNDTDKNTGNPTRTPTRGIESALTNPKTRKGTDIHVNFHNDITIEHIYNPYSIVYGYHASTIIFTGHIGDLSMSFFAA